MSALLSEIARLVSEHPVAQAVGLVALCITVLSYQARTTRGIALRHGGVLEMLGVYVLYLWTRGGKDAP